MQYCSSVGEFPMARILHVILNDGSEAVSLRSEVNPKLVAALRRIVWAGGGRLPGFPGFAVQLTELSERDATFALLRDNEEILALGLGADNPVAVWAELERQYFMACGMISPTLMPQEPPWLGVIVLPGLVRLTRKNRAWIGAWEYAMAWAVLERRVH